MEELRKRIKEKIKLQDSKTLHDLLSVLKKSEIGGDSTFNREGRNLFVASELHEILNGTREQRVQAEYDAAMRKIVDHLERDVLCDQIQTTDTNQTTSTAGAHTASENAASSE